MSAQTGPDAAVRHADGPEPLSALPGGVALSEPRTLTVTVTGPDKWLSSNGRHHWAVRNRLAQDWKTAGLIHTRNAMRLAGTGQIQAAELVVVVHWPDRRRRDGHNVVGGSIKAAVDGAVDAGLLVDDDDRHLRAVTVRTVVTTGTRPRMDMAWTEVGT